METKRFIGNDMPRIYARVKREYGPDAVIVRTRSLYREGAEPLIEVIAAPPDSEDVLPLGLQSSLVAGALEHAVQAGKGVTIGDLEDIAAREDERDAARAGTLDRVGATPAPAPDWLQGFVPAAPSAPARAAAKSGRPRLDEPDPPGAFSLPEAEDAQAPVADWRARPRISPAPRPEARRESPAPVVTLPARPAEPEGLMGTLLAAGFTNRAAQAVTDDATPGLGPAPALARYLESRDVRYPEEHHTALISIQGPVGSGRTTSLMRMALDCADTGRKTLLIAADGVHVAAREQVRAYAEATGLESASSFDKQDLVKTATRIATGTCLFVDTPAGSWRPPAIAGIPHFAYLALPAHWSRSALEGALRTLDLGGFAGAILTFTDLATDLTPTLSLLVESGLGIAFVSSSRDVSTGIEVADPLMLSSGLFTTLTRESTNGRLFATA